MSLLALAREAADIGFESGGDTIEPIRVDRVVSGTYDPDTSEHTIDAAIDLFFETDCIPEEYKSEDLVAGIQRGDVRVWIRVSETKFEPRPEHKAVFRGETWGIESVGNHSRVLYEVQLRRPR
jgi:hypothetical protein